MFDEEIQSRQNLRFRLIGGSVGFSLTVIGFFSERLADHLIYFVLPATIVALLVSGGEAGGPEILYKIGVLLAIAVNTLLYALFGHLLYKAIRFYSSE
jgi:predicted permease